MPHVEMSLTDDRRRSRRPPPRAEEPPSGPEVPAGSGLERWAAVAATAREPCLVLRADTTILVASAKAAELMGFSAGDAAGRTLREVVTYLIDFNDSPGQLDQAEADKIPPLLAITSERLARGLIRVACPKSGTINTMDAIATPLYDSDGTTVVGSLSFFSAI